MSCTLKYSKSSAEENFSSFQVALIETSRGLYDVIIYCLNITTTTTLLDWMDTPNIEGEMKLGSGFDVPVSTACSVKDELNG